ncbi:unnamed protein product [Meganyctiphanes norvegica]|uniref:Uncharacterized protein n=1 Tax=Meganyctiphanes norvegica TaxID=48144 RepID=A0AAV2QGG2_MEGNR
MSMVKQQKLKMKQIQTLQNQLLKVLSSKNYRFSTNELHKEFNLLKVEDISKQEILTFVHNYFSNSLPPVFDNYYETFGDNYVTRNGANTIRIKTMTLKLQPYQFKSKVPNYGMTLAMTYGPFPKESNSDLNLKHQ